LLNELAEKIANEIKDYRQDDGIIISPQHVITWANQFSENDRVFLLEETFNILDQRYLPRANAEEFMVNLVSNLANKLKYSNIETFLRETIFLDLQAKGKSQKELLGFIAKTIKVQYNFDINDCDLATVKNFIYIDDMLCTGNTAFNSIKAWLQKTNDKGETQLSKLRSNNCKVIFYHIFSHKRNQLKLDSRFKKSDLYFNRLFCHLLEVDNDINSQYSKLDFIFPIKQNQPQSVIKYFSGLGVEEREVFRNPHLPKQEELFTSPQNRIRYENLLLHTGLRILERIQNPKENLRPLGYTLPTHKNFGFGTLCFTWRNIANTTPIVFWYSTQEWTPLFEKKDYDLF
jgi:hypothetical protein